MSDKLVSAGYRIARVEQVETPDQLKSRQAKVTEYNSKIPKHLSSKKLPKPSAVARTICGIKSKGTRTCGVIDVYAGKIADDAALSAGGADGSSNSSGAANMDLAYGDTSAVAAEANTVMGGGHHLLAIREVLLPQQQQSASASSSAAASSLEAAVPTSPSSASAAAAAGGGGGVTHTVTDPAAFVHVGVVVTDTLTGDIRIAEFIDDRNRTRLRTLLARYPVGEILCCMDRPGSDASSSPLQFDAGTRSLSSLTRRFLRSDTTRAVRSALVPGSEFWSATTTASELLMEPYGVPLMDLAAGSTNSSGAGVTDVTFELQGLGDGLRYKISHTGSSSVSSAAGAASSSSGSSSSNSREEVVTLSTVRMRDYFDGDPEGTGQQQAKSSGSSRKVGDVIREGSGDDSLVTVIGADRKARSYPAVLYQLLETARLHEYDPAQASLPTGSGSGAVAPATVTAATDLEPSTLALSCLGATVYWLRRCLIDHHVLSLRKMSVYRHADGIDGGSIAALGNAAAADADDVEMGGSLLDPSTAPSIRNASSTAAAATPSRGHGEGGPSVPHMQLDGTTLANLELLENSWDGSRKGSLLALLDQCCTPMGKRMFRQWICAPLFRVQDIEDRLKAVDDLMNPYVEDTVLKNVRKVMRTIPDLERLLARIHGLGSRVGARDHPDARAMFYEEVRNMWMRATVVA